MNKIKYQQCNVHICTRFLSCNLNCLFQIIPFSTYLSTVRMHFLTFRHFSDIQKNKRNFSCFTLNINKNSLIC